MIRDLVQAARERRAHLVAETEILRVFHGHGDGDSRWDAERAGNVIVIYAYRDIEDDLGEIASALQSTWEPHLIWLKERWRKDQSEAATRGRKIQGVELEPEVIGTEGPFSFSLEIDRGFNSGLFLDARPVRRKLLSFAKDQTVLNVFSYTGSLGIACLKGGASQVTHVDSQRAMERRIARNYELNDLPWDPRALRVGDAYRILRNFGQRKRRFELVILDPPPGVRPKGKRRHAKGQDYKTLLKLAVPLVHPEGTLLTFLNQRGISSKDHREAVLHATDGAATLEWTATSGDDFPEECEEKRLRIFAHRIPKPPVTSSDG